MRLSSLSLRFLLPLAVALTALAFAVVPLVDNLTQRWFIRDLDIRSRLIGETLRDPLADLLANGKTSRISDLFDRAIRDERLLALAYCDPQYQVRLGTRTVPDEIRCPRRLAGNDAGGEIVESRQGPLHVMAIPLNVSDPAADAGSILVVHDMSFVQRRSRDSQRYVLLLFLVLGVVVALITIVVAQLSWRGWMSGVQALLKGEGLFKPFERSRPDIEPLVGNLRDLLRQIDDERQARDNDARSWTADELKRLMRSHLLGDEVIVVSNREPYIHMQTPTGVEVTRPASGLVTAVEPVMRACSGTWIAHGSGSADRSTVDARDRLLVPPGHPAYTLRRVWLNEQEERGYYYGFANEGLWPLCHNAHVRPLFRESDWQQYEAVNARFAQAVAAEAKTDDPIVLVQDYHFALLPRMVRDLLPKATIITFWHIPWPNHESFGICPWRGRLLEGMLGSTIMGFHTPFHAKMFLETVDRYLETRIDHEESTVSLNGERTLVASYPISIHWPEDTTSSPPDADPIASARKAVRERFDLPADHWLAVGVDRLDYTKGIVERLLGVEQLLERHPKWRGRFSLVQIAAPTRSTLPEYQAFEAKVRETARRVNDRFGNDSYQPVILLIEHHGEASVLEHYRACDVCLVTSLHDGMNLVAKEFVAARGDEQGVLILSQFAGAARELLEALIVNPYHLEEVADAIDRALSMSGPEQRERMRSLRALVRDFNVYRWAGHMLQDGARIRRHNRLITRIARPGVTEERRIV